MVDSTQLVDKEIYETFDPSLRKAFEVSDDTSAIKDYSKIKVRKDSLLLSGDTMFPTLQGEGPTIGMPCVFVRLHICNLRCTWCDAFYTWNPSSVEFWTEATRMSFQQCANLIEVEWAKKFPDNMIKRIVWTGGEPLVQRKQIEEVMKLLLSKGAYVHEIETNGTLMPTQYQLDHCQFNCSPKLVNSLNEDYSMIKPKVLKALNNVNSTFKFVCRTESDLEEIEKKYLPHIYKSKIVIMPEGIREDEISFHAKQLYEPVMKRGWRMTPRFQATFADGARRRV